MKGYEISDYMEYIDEAICNVEALDEKENPTFDKNIVLAVLNDFCGVLLKAKAQTDIDVNVGMSQLKSGNVEGIKQFRKKERLKSRA